MCCFERGKKGLKKFCEEETMIFVVVQVRWNVPHKLTDATYLNGIFVSDVLVMF